jgi:hypothetical protein
MEIKTNINNNAVKDVAVVAMAEHLGLEIYNLRQKIKAMQDNEKALVAQLYDLGVLDRNDYHKEQFETDKVVLTKSPRTNGYDLQAVRKIADTVGISRKEVITKEWKFTANTERLAILVAEGKIPQEMVDNCKVQTVNLYVKPTVK